MNSFLLYVITSFGIILLDRWTKALALMYWMRYCVINKYLSFGLVINRGISWGLLHSHSHNDILFYSVTALIIIVTLVLAYYAYQRYKQGAMILAEVSILAGSVSNIIDRFIYGGVIDFIIVHYKHWFFPVFNIADIFIVLGVLSMFISVFWIKNEQ